VPHFTIEYSANLEGDLDLDAMFEAIRRAAVATGVFPLGGIRIRALRADHFTVADGDPRHGFVDLVCRLGRGRDLPTRRHAGEAVFQALSRFLDPVFARRSLALSFEMREIDPDLSWRRNPIHETLKKA